MHRVYLRIASLLGLAALGIAIVLSMPVAAAPIEYQLNVPVEIDKSVAAATITPILSVEPAALTFTAHIIHPRVQTGTLTIRNLDPREPLTWTASADAPGTLQPVIAPISGVNTATLAVQVDTSPFTLTGLYTAAIHVSALPAFTLGSPVTVGVTLIVTDQFRLVYLPVVAENYSPSSPPPIGTTQFGFNFISSAEARADETRYQRATQAGAVVNRWPFYWDRIELNPLTQPGVFSWAWQDENTINDIHHGLTIDAILLGIPPGLAAGSAQAVEIPRVGQVPQFQPDVRAEQNGTDVSTASVPQGLLLSVFSDGTDTPGSGKSINPANRWARFVHATVDRYRPGGVLAQQQGWTNGQGIRVWEVWNEPDLDLFYTGTVTEYARLLKVGYLATRHADPTATILFGGLANFQKRDWLRDTLNVIAADPDREANGWYFDAVATHNYAWAWQTFYNLYRARVTLDSFGLTGKRLWLNETGVAVCDDPPGPSCADPVYKTYRASTHEQAAYLIQTATFAIWLNADAMMFFQLYDDYGNGCPGIDAFGVVRNTPSAGCNPGNGLPRPAYDAFKMVTSRLAGLSPYWRKRPTINQELIALKNSKSGERVIAMWARDYLTETVTLSATSTSAVLVHPDGMTQTIVPVGGVYTVTLPAATNRNTPTTDGKTPIGGSPRILIERDPDIVVTP